MRSEHLTNMMQPTNFTDFNPLDVLAAAASLQSARIDGEDGEQTCNGGDGVSSAADEEAADKEGDDKVVQPKANTENVVVENGVSAVESGQEGAANAQTENGKNGVQTVGGQTVRLVTTDNGGNKSVVMLKDATKLVIPSPQAGKTFTILRVNKQQMADHSYAYVCQLQNLKNEEDEGYSSRSSVDEEVEDGHLRQVETPQTPGDVSSELGSPVELDKSSPGIVLDANVTSPNSEAARKPAKIVIVSKDSNIQQIVSAPAEPKLQVNTPTGRKTGNIVLRTLLGQRPLVSKSQKSNSGVAVRSVPTRQANSGNVKTALMQHPLPSNGRTIIVKKPESKFVSPMSPPIHIPKPQTHIVKLVTSNSEKPLLPPKSVVTEVKETIDQSKPQIQVIPDQSADHSSQVETDQQTDSKANSDDVLHASNENEEVKTVDSESSSKVVLDSLETNCTDLKDASPSEVVSDSEKLLHLEQPRSAIVEEIPPNSDCDSPLLDKNSETLTLTLDKVETCAQSTDISHDEVNSSVIKIVNEADASLTSNTDSSENLNDAADDTASLMPSNIQCDAIDTSISENNVIETVTDLQKSQEMPQIEESATLENNETNAQELVSTAVDENQKEISEPVLAEQPVSIILTEGISSEPQQEATTSVCEDLGEGTSVNNQYIIEDDVPPVVTTKVQAAVPKLTPDVVLSQPTVPLDTAVTKVTDAIPVDARPVLLTDQRTVVTTASQKTLPGVKQSLLKAPAIAKNNINQGNVVHVIPMVNPRRGGGLVAQVLPKTLQYVTAVPVPNKNVMRVVDPKIPVGTVLVPASVSPLAVAPGGAQMPARVQIIPNLTKAVTSIAPSPTTLIPIATPPITEQPITEQADTPPPAESEASLDAQINFTPVSTPREESVKTLERKTPTSFVIGRSAPTTPDKLGPTESQPGEKINLKISANSITENSDSVQSSLEKSKETTSIGTVGSISWKNLNANSGLIQLGSKGNQREFIRIQGSQIQTGIKPANELDRSNCNSPWLKPDDVSSVASATDEVTSRDSDEESSCIDPNDLISEDSNLSTSPPFIGGRGKRRADSNRSSRCSTPLWQNSELHPLIDHDYCMFTEFNAQIQSSIIATTESKVKTERKYNKKAKAARTKVVTSSPSYRGKGEKQPKGKRGKYKKRDTAQLLETKELDGLEPDVEDTKESSADQKETKKTREKRPMSERRKALAAKKKKVPTATLR